MTHRVDAASGVRRGTRRLPGPTARALDLSRIRDGAAFLRLGLAAVRPLCQVGAILRGDLRQYGETRCPPATEREPTGDSSGR